MNVVSGTMAAIVRMMGTGKEIGLICVTPRWLTKQQSYTVQFQGKENARLSRDNVRHRLEEA